MGDVSGIFVVVALVLLAAGVLAVIALLRGAGLVGRLDSFEWKFNRQNRDMEDMAAEIRGLRAQLVALGRQKAPTVDGHPMPPPVTEPHQAEQLAGPQQPAVETGDAWQEAMIKDAGGFTPMPPPGLSQEKEELVMRVATPETPTPPSEEAMPGPEYVPPFVEPVVKVPEPRTLEQHIIRLFIWTAAGVLALAGVYFVKWAVDHAILTDAAKLIITALFGLLLLGAGQVRQFIPAPIRQSVSAAGIVVLFGVIVAGSKLYNLLPSPVAFGLMIVVTALAVGLSLQQGPFVAALGLIGGFMTPLLIQTETPNIPGLFIYLFVLQLGLMVVTQRRRWVVLGLCTQILSLLWVVGLVAQGSLSMTLTPEDAHVMTLFVLAMVGTTLFTSLSLSGERAWGDTPGPAQMLSWVAMGGGMLVAAMLVRFTEFSDLEWVFFGILSIATLVLARARRAYAPMPWVSSALAVFLLFSGAAHGSLTVWSYVVMDLGPMAPEELTRYKILFAAFGALFTVGPYLCMWGSKFARRWVWLSASNAISFIVYAWVVLERSPRPVGWGLVPLTMVALYAVMSIPIFARRREEIPMYEALADLFTGMCVLVAVAMPMMLSDGWLTVSLAALVPAFILTAKWTKVPSPLACAMGVSALVAVRLVINPTVLMYEAHPAWWQNPVIYGHGLSLVMLSLAAWLLRGKVQVGLPHPGPGDVTYEKREAYMPEFAPAYWTAILHMELASIALIWVTLLVRLWFHPAGVTDGGATSIELASFAAAWLVMGWFMGRMPSPPVAYAVQLIGRVAAVIAGIYVVVVLCMFNNPLFTGESVGPRMIANGLLAMYAAPLVLAAMIGMDLTRRKKMPDGGMMNVVAVITLMTLVIGEIRQAVHGPVLTEGNFAFAELSGMLLATLLIGWGLVRLPRVFGGAAMMFMGNGLMALAMVGVVFGLGLFDNPWVTGDRADGMPVFNLILFAYGAPMVAVALIGLDMKRRGRVSEAMVCSIEAIALLFAVVTLEIRQGYHPLNMATGEMGQAELYTYSAGWAALALALLVSGVALKSHVLRISSLVIMVLAIGKVFFDVFSLGGLLRVVSLLGLGIALMAVGWIYYKWVFGKGFADAEEGVEATPG